MASQLYIRSKSVLLQALLTITYSICATLQHVHKHKNYILKKKRLAKQGKSI